MKFMMKMAAMTTMMAGPRTVGLGCISLVQRLDERSKASLNNRPIEWYAIIYITNTRKQGANCPNAGCKMACHSIGLLFKFVPT
jgi:hypothetical protein